MICIWHVQTQNNCHVLKVSLDVITLQKYVSTGWTSMLFCPLAELALTLSIVPTSNVMHITNVQAITVYPRQMSVMDSGTVPQD